jgi:hypothetical protein
MRRRWGCTAALAGVLTAALVPLVPVPATAAGPDETGAWGAAFTEPGERCKTNADGSTSCLPSAATSVVLANGRNLYWDALDGIQNAQYSAVIEFGRQARNDLSRVLDIRSTSPVWIKPTPEDGGANQDGNGNEYVGPLPHSDPNGGQGDLFCSDQVQLPDGRIFNVGGTSYYSEPSVPGTDYGIVELEGLKNTRLFDPRNNTWTQLTDMKYGRWYPSLVTLPDNKVFVASGVTKLIKPMYPDRPTDSGTNVKQTETWDPKTLKWTVNPASADKSLPLYPRLHLLPNGHVFYDASGQTFNPDGQSYDEALWNMASSYDPKSQRWTDLGLPVTGPLRGFRGSTFSVALPIKAPYTSASFLSAGGVYGVTPGSYISNNTSTINTVTVGSGGDTLSSAAAGNLVTSRWYPSGVPLPTGEVLAVSGADRDEVVGPGSGTPTRQAEIFDPATKTWKGLASSPRGRTYHNSAVLLPDARVLVGGHAPIATLYYKPTPVPGMSDPARDPSFEIFSPPYLFRGPRPVIRSVSSRFDYGKQVTISTTDAPNIESVVLMRNPALTHLIDGDQRTVDLPIVRRTSQTITVLAPPRAEVAPNGPYLLFENKRTPKGLIPSVSRQIFLGSRPSGGLARDIKNQQDRDTKRELADRKKAFRDAGLALPSTGGLPLAGFATALIIGGGAFGLVVRRRRTAA